MAFLVGGGKASVYASDDDSAGTAVGKWISKTFGADSGVTGLLKLIDGEGVVFVYAACLLSLPFLSYISY